MKIKTSITMSTDVLAAVDKYADGHNRSEFIETAVRAFIAEIVRREQDERDLEIINRHADRLNEEAMDVLSYQVSW
jgi:metal-responsive CopG/Arc/MetJ family transcriptional regulator